MPGEKESIHQDSSDQKPHSEESKAQTRVPPGFKSNGDRAGAPYTFHLTDWGNAQWLVVHNKNIIRYCHVWGKWMIWDSAHWQIDESEEIMRLAEAAVHQMYQAAWHEREDKMKKALSVHALKSESESKLKSMISLAGAEPGIPVKHTMLDPDPWLLNCQNGTLNLRNGELREHKQTDLITKLIRLDYDPKAECPLWNEFLLKIMGGNEALTQFIQRVVGYSLTGDVSEQCLFMGYGTGSNGKSTFLKVIQTMMFDYAAHADFGTFLIKDNQGIPNDLARLVGKRFVAAVEVESGKRLAEVVIKNLTGGDVVTARFLHREFFEFTPQCKIFLAMNHKPTIWGTDHAIWRRIKLIPFEVTIPAEEQDQQLVTKLMTELPGILTWAVRGCLYWVQDGLSVPKEVNEATKGYRSEMDVLGGFMDECCNIGADLTENQKAMYKTYCDWAERDGEKPMGKRSFGNRMLERGFQVRASHSTKFWIGINLKEPF